MMKRVVKLEKEQQTVTFLESFTAAFLRHSAVGLKIVHHAFFPIDKVTPSVSVGKNIAKS